jgi:small GTP-binding protein
MTSVLRRLSTRVTSNSLSELQAEKQEIAENHDFKIGLVGFSNSGKSCIVQQFCMNQFATGHEETIEDTYNRKVRVELKSDLLYTPGGGKHVLVNLQISDTGKRTTLNEISADTIAKCNGILLVFAVTSQESYAALMDFYDDVQRMQPGIAVVVVANKCDENQEISDTAIGMVAAACNAPFIKVSASKRNNIDECFAELVNEILMKQFVAPVGLEHLQMGMEDGTDVKKKRNTLSHRLSRVFKK